MVNTPIVLAGFSERFQAYSGVKRAVHAHTQNSGATNQCHVGGGALKNPLECDLRRCLVVRLGDDCELWRRWGQQLARRQWRIPVL